MLTVRVGCKIHFECESSATVILLVNPRSDPDRPIRQETLDFGRATKFESFVDTDDNIAYRIILGTGLNEIRHDAMVEVSPHRTSPSNSEMPHQSPHSSRHFCDTCYPADIAIRTSYSLSPGKSSDTYMMRAIACRPSPTGFITTSSIALLPEGRIFRLRR